MDPFTIALATFGIQKLRGKSTKRSLRDAAIAGGIGQIGGMAGVPGLSASEVEQDKFLLQCKVLDKQLQDEGYQL
mgnify:CR=1 FL=1